MARQGERSCGLSTAFQPRSNLAILSPINIACGTLLFAGSYECVCYLCNIQLLNWIGMEDPRHTTVLAYTNTIPSGASGLQLAVSQNGKDCKYIGSRKPSSISHICIPPLNWHVSISMIHTDQLMMWQCRSVETGEKKNALWRAWGHAWRWHYLPFI